MKRVDCMSCLMCATEASETRARVQAPSGMIGKTSTTNLKHKITQLQETVSKPRTKSSNHPMCKDEHSERNTARFLGSAYPARFMEMLSHWIVCAKRKHNVRTKDPPTKKRAGRRRHKRIVSSQVEINRL